MVQRVLSDDRRDPLDHGQMPCPPRDPGGEERIRGREEEEEEVVLLGAGEGAGSGNLRSGGNLRHNLRNIEMSVRGEGLNEIQSIIIFLSKTAIFSVARENMFLDVSKLK